MPNVENRFDDVSVTTTWKYIQLAIIFHYLITFFLFFIFNRLHFIYILYKQIEKQQITWAFLIIYVQNIKSYLLKKKKKKQKTKKKYSV